MDYTSQNKWLISFISAGLFLFIASPVAYSLTNTIFSRILGINTIGSNGCSTFEGLVIHSIVFLLLTRALMM